MIKKFDQFDKVNEDITSGTKILFIKGTDSSPDYAAAHFAQEFHGTEVSEIIANPEAYKDPNAEDVDDAQWEVMVLEFGPIDRDFVTFILREGLIDYDMTKSDMFYFPDQVIGRR